MQIPSYRTVHLSSSDCEQIYSQLHQLFLEECPYLLVIDHMEVEEKTCLASINKYFQDFPHRALPYPTYIQTSLRSSEFNLNTVSSENQLPRFFKIKERTLNNKEAASFNKLELLRNNLKNIDMAESLGHLQLYAQNHKQVQSKDSKLQYYRKLISELE